MQMPMQSDQFADGRTGHQRHLVQVENQPGTAGTFNNLVQLDAKLIDIVFFTKTRLRHRRNENRRPIFDGEVGGFEFLE